MRKGICCAVLMLSAFAWAKNWEYESHYPVLPEPWYFTIPTGLCVDAQGIFYVTSRNRIFKLDSQGHVLRVYQPPPFFETENHFEGIAADGQGNMYVLNAFYATSQSIRVLIKYDSNGNYVKHLGADIWDLYVGGTNTLFVLYLDKIVIMDLSFDPLFTFGSMGNGDGQFYLPSGIWVDNSGKIFIADGGNYRIQVFDPSGIFLYKFGSKGTNPGQFQLPVEVCTDAMGNIYVYDFGDSKVKKFTSAGAYLKSWGINGNLENQFSHIGKMIQNNGRIYTEDYYLNRIQYFDAEGNFLGLWAPNGTSPGQLMQAKRLDVDNSGGIYLCDTGNYRIQKFDRKWGLEMAIGSKGSGPGQFQGPNGLAVDDEGHIFVLDGPTKRVQKFDKKGAFMTQWQGSDPFGPFLFDDPVDVDVDKDGYVYVLDKDGGYVHRFTNGGGFVASFGLKRDAQGYPLSSPVAFALDNQSRILAVNLSSEVYVNTRDGAYIATLPVEAGFAPYDLDTDNQGRLYLVQYLPSLGMVADPTGARLASFGGGTDLLKDLNGGVSIAVGNDGKVYVLEGNRVVVYRPGPGTPRTVPAAASIRGALGTDWRTDLSIFNPGSSAIDITLDYHKADGPLSSTFTLQPSAFLSLPDVIGTTFNAPNTFGALTAVCLNDNQPLIFSRTYNQVDQGTYGQGIRASPYGVTFYQGDLAFLTGLKNTLSFRSNVGFFNLQDIPIEVQLILYDEAGVELASASYPLAALSHFQVNNIFSSLALTGDHEAAWAQVWTDTLWGRFAAYGSIVDNRTGDPIYLEAKSMGGTMPEDFHWILPAVASTPGAYGTNWRTEAVFTNPPLESTDVTLTYHPATGGDPFVLTFTLEPGEVKSFSNFLDEAFALNESFGWLEIDASCAGLQARARIFTGETGTYGQGLQAQQQNSLSLGTSPVYLLNLLENETYRSNLGLLNLSDAEKTFTFDLLKDSSVVSSKTLTLSGQTLQQLNGVLSSFFETSGDGYTVKITGPEGAIYTAYLSTVDNRNGDAVYQSFSSQ